MSIHKLSAGSGYDYLTRQVAALDATDKGHVGLDSYYTERGESPGSWIGSGMVGIDGLNAGDAVTAEQMRALFGAGMHPLASQRLGAVGSRRFDRHQHQSSDTTWRAVQRLPRRCERLPRRGGQADSRTPWGSRTTARRSGLCGNAGADTHGGSASSFEQSMAAIRSIRGKSPQPLRRGHGRRQGRNGIRQVNVTGLVAAAFIHRDSRAGDPDLHTHVAVANKVQTLDGRWLSIDGRVLFKAAVAGSET
jgi:TrwC relaxase